MWSLLQMYLAISQAIKDFVVCLLVLFCQVIEPIINFMQKKLHANVCRSKFVVCVFRVFSMPMFFYKFLSKFYTCYYVNDLARLIKLMI